MGVPYKDIDYGINLLHAVAAQGVAYDLEEIALFADCSLGYIWKIEKAAIAKVRAAFPEMIFMPTRKPQRTQCHGTTKGGGRCPFMVNGAARYCGKHEGQC